jgi:hypothetical protein
MPYPPRRWLIPPAQSQHPPGPVLSTFAQKRCSGLRVDLPMSTTLPRLVGHAPGVFPHSRGRLLALFYLRGPTTSPLRPCDP